MNINTMVSLGACIMLIIVWMIRGKKFINSAKLFILTKKFKFLKGCVEIIKLFGFDAIVTCCTMFILGGTSSIFGLQLIIWINAITTVAGQTIFEFVKKSAEVNDYAY